MHELATCFGSGVLGMGYVLINGNTHNVLKYLTLSSIGAGFMYSLVQRNRKKTVNENNVILITGCDSGLGYLSEIQFRNLREKLKNLIFL